MPEGDTIFRSARTLQRALGGDVIQRFESGLPQIAGIERHTTIVGRTIEQVEARGKHLLMHLSQSLVLRTHMRMQGSWHIYRPGEKWQRPRHQMRIVIETERFCAVAFLVHEAEWLTEKDLPRSAVGRLGPDVLASEFDPEAAAQRIVAQGVRQIGDVLLDQRVLAGIGNVYRSELLFMARVHPLKSAQSVSLERARFIAREAARLLRENVGLVADREREGALREVPGPGMRTTTRRCGERLWVYGRAGEECLVCGGKIVGELVGEHARRCYYCVGCQRADA
ncbi:MAG: hypothetical protein RL701_436 [Pseudomonadota bacterium]